MAEEKGRQRRFPRLPSHYTVLVQKIGDSQLEELAQTHSLSLGGCGFWFDQALGEGTVLELVIGLDLHPLSIPARVVYQHPADRDGFEIGAEFLSLGADERRILERLFNQDVRH
jgi:hypothetical protein